MGHQRSAGSAAPLLLLSCLVASILTASCQYGQEYQQQYRGAWQRPSSAVVELTGHDFYHRITGTRGFVLVNFYAPWSSWSQRLRPAYEQVAVVLQNEVLVAAIDADQYRQIADEFRVHEYPTIVLLSVAFDGRIRVLEEVKGYMDVQSVLDMVNKATSYVQLGTGNHMGQAAGYRQPPGQQPGFTAQSSDITLPFPGSTSTGGDTTIPGGNSGFGPGFNPTNSNPGPGDIPQINCIPGDPTCTQDAGLWPNTPGVQIDNGPGGNGGGNPGSGPSTGTGPNSGPGQFTGPGPNGGGDPGSNPSGGNPGSNPSGGNPAGNQAGGPNSGPGPNGGGDPSSPKGGLPGSNPSGGPTGGPSGGPSGKPGDSQGSTPGGPGGDTGPDTTQNGGSDVKPGPGGATTPAPSGPVVLTVDSVNNAKGCIATSKRFGYACKRQLLTGSNSGTWELYYKVSTSGTPPSNLCTTSSGAPAPLPPLPAGATHWMHVLLTSTQAAADNWVGFSFPQTAGKMFPANALIGYMDRNGKGTLNTYSLTAYALPDPDPTSWAQNPSIMRSASDGTTMMCFSRAVTLGAAPSGRRLYQTPDATILDLSQGMNMNVAVGPVQSGRPAEHSFKSPAPSISFATSPSPTTSGDGGSTNQPNYITLNPSGGAGGDVGTGSTAGGSGPTPGTTNQAPLTAAALNSASGCNAAPNSFNYACNRLLPFDGWTLSYTVSDSATPPDNPCTKGIQGGPAAQLTLPPGASAWIHFMVTSKSQGWVAMSFAQTAGKMFPADAVLGGTTSKGPYSFAYTITDYTLPKAEGVNSWAKNMGASTTSDGKTAICFSRPAQLPGGKAPAGRRLQQQSGPYVNLGKTLQLNFATANVDDITVKHDFKAGHTLDLTSGASATVVKGDNKKWVRTHGILMIVAFIGIMPTAIMMARHKRLLPNKLVAGKGVWFWLHVCLQLTAVICFGLAVAIALVKFDDNNIPTAAGLLEAHGVIGLTMIALVAVQLLIGFIRPSPEANKRWLWNLLHHNWGRVTVLLAWFNVSVGIYLWEELYGPGVWKGWVIAVCVTAGCILLVESVATVAHFRAPPPTAYDDLEKKEVSPRDRSMNLGPSLPPRRDF